MYGIDSNISYGVFKRRGGGSKRFKFGFCNPNKGGSGQAFMYALLDNVAGENDKYTGDTEVDAKKIENWDQAWKWLQDRKDQLTITASNKDSLSRLNSGEFPY